LEAEQQPGQQRDADGQQDQAEDQGAGGESRRLFGGAGGLCGVLAHGATSAFSTLISMLLNAPSICRRSSGPPSPAFRTVLPLRISAVAPLIRWDPKALCESMTTGMLSGTINFVEEKTLSIRTVVSEVIVE